jgi:hypothetical protein
MATSYLRADSVRANPSLQSPNLRIAISVALRRHGIPPTRFGRDAVGDPRFVLDVMRYEREPRPKTEARVRAYIASLDGETAR